MKKSNESIFFYILKYLSLILQLLALEVLLTKQNPPSWTKTEKEKEKEKKPVKRWWLLSGVWFMVFVIEVKLLLLNPSAPRIHNWIKRNTPTI